MFNPPFLVKLCGRNCHARNPEGAVAREERVLITGGSGFLGACLAHDLVSSGKEIHLLLRPGSDTWRLTPLVGRYTSHHADLLDLSSLRRVIADCRPEVIYHLATHGVYPSQTDRRAVLATTDP